MPISINRRRAQTEQAVDALTDEIKKRFLLQDPGALYAVLGTWAANQMQGIPLWLMLVGPASHGGSIMLHWLKKADHMHYAGRLTMASLLSAVPAKDKAKDHTGGLLREIGDFGILVVDDFTSVLCMPREAMADLLSALRYVSFGEWTRQAGSDGGRGLTWKGKMGLMAKSTPAIDDHHAAMSEMGDRFIFWRFPPGNEASDYAFAKAAIKNTKEPELMEEVQELVAAYLGGLDIPKYRPVLSAVATSRLAALSTLAARIRGTVKRESSYKRDIIAMPSAEKPGRLGQWYSSLYAGMKAVGVGEAAAWKAVGQAARDSAPLVRRMILEYTAYALRSRGSIRSGLGKEWVTVGDLMKIAYSNGISWGSETVLRRGLEELEVLFILERTNGVPSTAKASTKGRPADMWRMTEWCAREWKEAGW